MSHDKKTNGFTLVELAMAMAFVSLLLILITLTVIQISNIYSRGITVKEVNQVGRSLADDIKRTISQSSNFNTADNFIVIKDGADEIGGRLCTSNYSYVWNYGKALSAGNQGNKYMSPNSAVTLSFVRVADTAYKMCQKDSGDYPDIDKSKSTELVGVGDRNLAIHNFSASLSGQDPATGQQLYKIDFTLGTNNQAEIDAANNNCKVNASHPGSNLAYCSINHFSLMVRVGNKAQ